MATETTPTNPAAIITLIDNELAADNDELTTYTIHHEGNGPAQANYPIDFSAFENES